MTEYPFKAYLGFHLERVFDDKLRMAVEEHPDKDHSHQCHIAAEWAEEYISYRLGQIVEKRIAGHQEAVNKAHFT
jgi:hypothetical protein